MVAMDRSLSKEAAEYGFITTGFGQLRRSSPAIWRADNMGQWNTKANLLRFLHVQGGAVDYYPIIEFGFLKIAEELIAEGLMEYDQSARLQYRLTAMGVEVAATIPPPNPSK